MTPPPLPTGQPVGRPAAEVDVTPALVRILLQHQHPDLADEPLLPADAGWDNAMFRLGEQLAVRLPRRSAAERLILNEQKWLSLLAARLPLSVPAPVRTGKPGDAYPWHWSVVPWLSGVPASISPPDGEQGERLADFLNTLHAPAPADAPTNSFRGVPLASRKSALEERFRRLEARTVAVDAKLGCLCTRALEAPLDAAPTWIHGDLHAQNVLVSSGHISAVIDWGDLCQGDRATDLAAIWMLLPSRDARERAMNACPGVSEATWDRARGWAIFFGVVLSDSGLAGDPVHAAMGKQILERLLEGP